MSWRSGVRHLLAAIASLVLVASCRANEPTPSSSAMPTVPFTTRGAAASTATTMSAPPQWAGRSFSGVDASGTPRTCVELTVSSTVASMCLAQPGVSSWTVADAHFVVAASDIALSDGTVMRADASGVAIGLLPPDVAPSTDTRDTCPRRALAPAVAEHYPDSTVSWVPSRCAGGAAAVSAVLADRSIVTALAAQANDGHWEVFATFRPPVRCALLDVRSRDLCKLLRYAD